MKRLGIISIVLGLAFVCAAHALAAGKVAGRLYDPGGSGWKEFFVWFWQEGKEEKGGDYTDMGGYWKNSRLEPGMYTFGLTRMFDLGPVIKPNILVEEGKTTSVAMIWPADYWVRRDTNMPSEPHKRFAQCWVTRGGSILEAGLDIVKEDDQMPEVMYSIHEGGPTGRQIGPSAKGTWKHGEVKVEHGKTYCLVASSNKPFKVYRGQEKHLKGDVYFDGQKQEKTVIGGRTKIDRDGIITRRFAWVGAGAEMSGACEKTIGQTFKAKGNGLAMFDFTFIVGSGRRVGLGSTLRVLEGGPGGKQVGTIKKISHHWDFHLRNSVWARGECPLTAGKTYYIEITCESGPFQVLRIKDDLPDGELYMDGKPVPGYDIETCLIEYAEDHTPPPPVNEFTVDSAGNAYQLSFDIPRDMDCSMAEIRRAEGNADPLKGEPLKRLYVSADQTYLYVDRDVKPGKKYRYAVTMLDESGNESPAQIVDAEPLTASAESNLLVNGDFVMRKQGGGGIAPGWESLRTSGGASAFMGGPMEEGEGGSLCFWAKYANYDCEFYQQVPAEKGRSYRLTAYSKVKDPWNNGKANEIAMLGIDPLGRLDTMAPEVVWSSPNIDTGNWVKQTVWTTAQSDEITVYLRARSMYGGFGMEARFSNAKLVATKRPAEIAVSPVTPVTAREEAPSKPGELIVDWAYNWGDFNEAADREHQLQFPWNWYEHDEQGVAYIRDLAPSYYTVGISRAFGLGPMVQPYVWVGPNKPTRVTVDHNLDYFAEPSGKTIAAKTIAQPFIAKGVSAIKAGVFFEQPFPPKSVTYEIREGAPDGPKIGDHSKSLDDATGEVGSWVHGDIPLKEGQLYYLVCNIENPEAKPYLAASADENAVLYVDGKALQGRAIAGFVQSDPPGLITTLTSPAGMKDDKTAHQYSQSFVAKGTSLALVDFVPWFETESGEFDVDVGIKSTGHGDSDVHRRARCKNGKVSQVTFAPGEVELTPGQVYFVQLGLPTGQEFSVNWTWQIYKPGCFWRHAAPVHHWDIDMNILEYAPTDVAPEPPGFRCLSGDGFTRLEYTAPATIGVSKVQVRYRDNWFGSEFDPPKLQDKLLAEMDVTPGQYGVIHDYDRPANSKRQYFAIAIDRQGNVSDVSPERSYPGFGPILPAGSAIENADFSKPGSLGGPPANWDYRVLLGKIQFADTEGRVAWTAITDDADAVVFQTMTLTPGRTYRLSADAAGSAEVSIGVDPNAGFDPDAEGIVSSRPKSKVVIVRPEKPTITLFLRAKGKDVSFSEVKIADITMR